MNKLNSEINKAAHYLAQVHAVRIKYALDAQCRAMLKEGKSKDDVARYLGQLATDGGSGLGALMGGGQPNPLLTQRVAGRGLDALMFTFRTGAL